MFSITPSDIIQYLYCPRFTYFEKVLCIPQFEEKNFKVMQGRHIHELKSMQNKHYLRQRIGAVEKRLNVYLTNQHLRGEVDEILWLKDGTAAPLDYKFARWEDRVYETYHTQLACYAWLIEDNFGIKVRKGFLVYVRSNHHLECVNLDENDIERVKIAASGVYAIITNNVYPRATKVKSRCDHCTYRNVCTC
jgi:CRISPR-associated exonuclease Cas4